MNLESFRKKKAKTPEEGSEKGVNPYLDARQVWNDRTASLVSSRQTWQVIALLSFFFSLVALAGIIYISDQSKIVPYVVEVNKLGEPLAVSAVDKAAPVDPRVIRAAVASFITDARMVTADVALERAAVLRVYSMLSADDPATEKMNEWLNGSAKSNPFVRAQNEMVNTDILSVIPQTGSTWQVDWMETVRDRSGALTKDPFHMRALVTVYVVPPTTASQMQRNPMGIFVRNFSWSKLGYEAEANK